MKLNTKIIGVLVISSAILSVSLLLTLMISLRTNQEDNIAAFKNEFVELSLELFGNNADLFFQYMDTQIAEHDVNSTEEFFNLIGRLDPNGENVLLIDMKTAEFARGYNRANLRALLDESTIQLFLRQNLLNKKTRFEVDNYDEFLGKNTTSVPTKLYVRIYSSFGLIVAYGESFSSGKVRIEYIENNNEKFYDKSRNLALLIFVVTLTLIPLLSIIMMKRSITNPINTLQKGFSELIKGNYSTKIRIDSNDEMGELAKNFNQMSESLKGSKKTIRQYETGLEKKIKERTAEIKERTAELEIKNEKLEHFNKLVMDRELKMIELKKRISELEKRSKK